MFFKYLWVFFISMVPIIELRGAIPVGVGMGLPLVPTYIVSIIGNMLPVPFIYLFGRKVLEWGKDKRYIGKWFTWMYEKGIRAGEKINGKRGIFIGLMLFVAIPLPGTGAWTGTLAASILNMKFRDSVLAAMGGVLIAGVIMMLISAGVFSFV
ncbi:MAG: small multi-drug export protein [Lachnospiraceae bacterium]|nr:small multi-drug export protein [Lachnospiraceae bacterium]